MQADTKMMVDSKELSENQKLDFNVLSFDGGGTKAAFYFYLFEALNSDSFEKTNRVNVQESADLVVGTSSGAIFAAAIACKIMGTEVWKRHTSDLAHFFQKFFQDQNQSSSFVSAPMYAGKCKQEMLFDIFGSKKMGETNIPLAVVCTELNCEPVVFSSWATPEAKIFKVLDASSAAPICFPPVIINSIPYMDGGVSYNNPTLCSYLEAVRYVRQSIESRFAKIRPVTKIAAACSRQSSTILGSNTHTTGPNSSENSPKPVFSSSEPCTDTGEVKNAPPRPAVFNREELVVLGKKKLVVSSPVPQKPNQKFDRFQQLLNTFDDFASTSSQKKFAAESIQSHQTMLDAKAYQTAINIKIVSLGHDMRRHRIKFRCEHFVHEMGLTNLILLGVLDSMIYGSSKVELQLLQHILGKENLLRIDSGVHMMINSVSPTKLLELQEASKKVIQDTDKMKQIRNFFRHSN